MLLRSGMPMFLLFIYFFLNQSFSKVKNSCFCALEKIMKHLTLTSDAVSMLHILIWPPAQLLITSVSLIFTHMIGLRCLNFRFSTHFPVSRFHTVMNTHKQIYIYSFKLLGFDVHYFSADNMLMTAHLIIPEWQLCIILARTTHIY